MKKFLNLLKLGFEYFCKWKFRFSFFKFLGLYVSTITALVGGWQLAVSGHRTEENNHAVDDWKVEYGGLDWPTVVIIAIVTILFVAVLFYRDRDEVRKQLQDNDNRVNFEEIYIPFFYKLFDMLDVSNYKYWAHSISTTTGNVSISRERYYKLRELCDFCKQMQKIEGYESFYSITANLRLVLSDMLNVFDIHSRLLQDGIYIFHKFYSDHGYNENYDEESDEWIEEVYLISDLTFELTCISNLLLAKIRELSPSFLSEHGMLTIVDAENYKREKAPIVYQPDEVSANPYPGLKEFLNLRTTRQFHYGSGDKISVALRRAYLLR